MLKPLLFILAIVSLVALWLNVDFSDDTSPTIVQNTVEKPIVPEPTVQNRPVAVTTTSKSVLVTDDDNLSKEIQALFKQATLLFQKNLDEEALKIYNQIIQKIGNRSEIEDLKNFAQAYFQIGLIHQIYPNNDKDLAIEAYDMVIKRFEKSDDEVLLRLYIQAKLKQAYLFDDDERVEIYDELIKRFENYKGNKFQTEVEELLYTQSYALMGKDDDEAMRILDTIINKYDNGSNTPLPSSVKTSILNSIELAIITNNDDSKYRELADQYLSDSSDTKPLLSMLDIIRNAQDLEQDEALSNWKEEYANYRFPDWSFQELRNWMLKIEDKATQDRIKKYLDAFENHKYNTTDTTTYVTPTSDNTEGKVVYESPVYSGEPIVYESPVYETEPIIYESSNGEEVVYYPDPYANDSNDPIIYDSSTVDESPYPNPYVHVEETR